MVKSRFLHQTLKTEGESVFDTEFTRQTHQKGLIPNDSGRRVILLETLATKRGGERDVGGRGSGLGSACSSEHRWPRRRRSPISVTRAQGGGACHAVRARGPGLGSPSRLGSEHKPRPPAPSSLGWQLPTEPPTSPRGTSPRGPLKLHPTPDPVRSFPPSPLPPLLSCGVAGTLRPVQGRPQQCRQHGVAAMPCLGSRVHREPHAHVSPMTPSTWLL